MPGLYQSLFTRNHDLISHPEQNKIRKTAIAIAGVGGIGGLVAERLIRFGVERIKITDPGIFEKSNINRQYGSSFPSLGRNKAQEIHNQLKKMNPRAAIACNKKGITSQKDADSFVEGCSIIVDTMDYGLFKQAIFLQRAARKNNAYYLFSSAIGFGTQVVIFEPGGYTLEEYNNLIKDADISGSDPIKIAPESIMPDIPQYIIKSLGITKLKQIISGKRLPPVNSVGVGLSSIITAYEVINIILKKSPIVTAPEYLYIDMLEKKYQIKRKK